MIQKLCLHCQYICIPKNVFVWCYSAFFPLCNVIPYSEYMYAVHQSPKFKRVSLNETRAGRVPGGTIVLSRERTEWSKTIPSFQNKNERLERVLKNFGMISKRTERNRTGIAWKEQLKLLTHSYFQELVLSWERILNQECVSSSDFLCM